MNLAGIIRSHPSDAPALIRESGQVTTYGELRRAVAGFQRRLQAAGVTAGDRVAILAANDPTFVVAYLAVLSAGAVAVPLNVVSPPAEIQGQLAQVDVATIVVGAGCQHLSAPIASLTGIAVLPITADEEAPAGVAPAGVPTLKRVASAEGAPAEGAPATEGASAEPAPADPTPATEGAPAEPAPAEPAPEPGYQPVDRQPDDLAALLFTAGTAGSPRAAMLTHGNLLANLDQVQRHPGRALVAGDRVLGVLPLCHIFGLNAVLGGALNVGGSVVLLERFEAARTLAVIARQQVTIVVGAPTLFAALAGAEWESTGESTGESTNPMVSVRFAFSGAAPLSVEVAEAWEKRFGLPLRQGYGLTEAAPVVTTSVMERRARPASIGVPIPGVEVQLIDEDMVETLAGDPGEIWVRGPNVFPGYWHDPVATAAALTEDGWLRTGDIAVVGDDGELAIVNRVKDLIIVSGFNVYPAEVEEVLAEHPAVAEVAVVGDVDRYRGELVHAFVVLKDPGGAAPMSALNDWCRARLARYKCPSEITVVATLPHGLAGKLLRRSLRSAPAPTGR